jgi:hypothetical protein
MDPQQSHRVLAMKARDDHELVQYARLLRAVRRSVALRHCRRQFLPRRHAQSPHRRPRPPASLGSNLREATAQHSGTFSARQCALDRLSRRLSDVAAFHDRIRFRGLNLFAVDRGEITSMMVGVLGAMGQAYVDDLRHKTKRGLTGKILAGLAAGGLGYGYEVDSSVKGGRRIVEAEAKVVRRIFDLYAGGASPRAIVAKLNGERIPGPGGRPWIDTTVRGQADRGTGILNNVAYAGRLEWNRCSYVRNPGTGKRVARPNPRDEWEVMNTPELRIVDDELWNRAKARQQEVRTEMARDESGQALNRAHRVKHLLSGPIFCGECGAPFAMRDSAHYGCSNFRSKGFARTATGSNAPIWRRRSATRSVTSGLMRRRSSKCAPS